MDIIGFDAQINAPSLFKGVRTLVKKLPAPQPVKRVVVKKVAKPMARPAAKPTSKSFTKLMARPTAKPATKYAPAQVPYKVTAKTSTNVKANSNAASKAPLTIIKPSGKAIPLKTLETTTTPSVVKSVSPIQRSFMPVDLPYQTPTAKTKTVKIKNTPLGYNVNVNQIEPPVDAGVQNYYGK